MLGERHDDSIVYSKIPFFDNYCRKISEVKECISFLTSGEYCPWKLIISEYMPSNFHNIKESIYNNKPEVYKNTKLEDQIIIVYN